MELFKGKPDMQNLLKNKKSLMLLGGIGVLLLFNPFAWFKGQGSLQSSPASQVKPTGQQTTSIDGMSQYEAMIDTQMTDILNSIDGVSDAKVMITLDSGEETVYATDEQNNKQTTSEGDNKGGTRTTTQEDTSGKIVTVNKDGTNQALVTKVIRPKVRGVLVVAKGAESLKVQAMIMDAVQRALDVPYHRISIKPEKQQ
ncbi:MAG: stage III sporulation protein AG [Tumebacillaceae bacterium]